METAFCLQYFPSVNSSPIPRLPVQTIIPADKMTAAKTGGSPIMIFLFGLILRM